MLSYQHGYHAGNHADILKHAILARLIARLLEKEKPFSYIDTHAGAGVYRIDGDQAQKTGEMASGISKLLKVTEHPQILDPWFALTTGMALERNLYPGSPELVRALSREGDSLALMELHPTEAEALAISMKGDPRVHIHRRDGYAGLLALTPPEPRRGLCLIDPSYERDEEYERVAETAIAAHRRWPVGIIAIWYPIVERRAERLAGMLEKLKATGISGILRAELHVKEGASGEPTGGFGLTGSGMLVIQAPWRLDEELGLILDWLTPLLSEETGGYSRLEWLVPPA